MLSLLSETSFYCCQHCSVRYLQSSRLRALRCALAGKEITTRELILQHLSCGFLIGTIKEKCWRKKKKSPLHGAKEKVMLSIYNPFVQQ